MLCVSPDCKPKGEDYITVKICKLFWEPFLAEKEGKNVLNVSINNSLCGFILVELFYLPAVLL